MTWNIAYAYGQGSAGDDYHYRPRQEFLRRLDGIAELIRSEGADLVLLQEVDFRCGRSHLIDEMSYLSERTGLAYSAPAVSWKKLYIPFPYWPPRDHFGRMRSGGAVLSRFPIVGNEVHLLPKPLEFPWWYRLFYPYRYFQAVHLQIGDHRAVAVNLHLEAFKPRNRMAQAAEVGRWLREDIAGGNLLAVGGDFNSVLPPTDESTMDQFLGLPDLQEVGIARGLKGGTFPAERPDRRLDHLFVSRKYRVQAAGIIQTLNLSDHLPLVAAIQLQTPSN